MSDTIANLKSIAKVVDGVSILNKIYCTTQYSTLGSANLTTYQPSLQLFWEGREKGDPMLYLGLATPTLTQQRMSWGWGYAYAYAYSHGLDTYGEILIGLDEGWA